MHPLKFIEASAIQAIQLDGVTLSNAICQQCLVSFQENVRLVLGLSGAPGFSALITMQWAEAGTKAALQVFGKEYQKRLSKATPDQAAKHWKLTLEYMASIVDSRRPTLSNDLEVMTRQLEQHMMSRGPYVHGIFEGILKTVCIQSWGAIEVLFEELLTSVVDTNASFFPLLDSSKFYFRKLDGTRKWYKRAFDSDIAICKILEGEPLAALAEIRHVLVHKAGRVDEFFKNATSRISLLTGFSALGEDESIKFDGEMVRSLVDPAITDAYKLIQEVDRWINLRQQPGILPKNP